MAESETMVHLVGGLFDKHTARVEWWVDGRTSFIDVPVSWSVVPTLTGSLGDEVRMTAHFLYTWANEEKHGFDRGAVVFSFVGVELRDDFDGSEFTVVPVRLDAPAL